MWSFAPRKESGDWGFHIGFRSWRRCTSSQPAAGVDGAESVGIVFCGNEGRVRNYCPRHRDSKTYASSARYRPLLSHHTNAHGSIHPPPRPVPSPFSRIPPHQKIIVANSDASRYITHSQADCTVNCGGEYISYPKEIQSQDGLLEYTLTGGCCCDLVLFSL